MTRARRVASRRRIVFASGLTAMLLTAAAALALGTGCIFDDGGKYQGGGRRGTLPTSSEEAPLPNPTSTGTSTSSSTTTSTSTSSAAPDGGNPTPQDASGN